MFVAQVDGKTNFARQAMEAEDFNAAIRFLQEGLQVDGDNEDLRIRLVAAQDACKRQAIATALRKVEEVLALSPTDDYSVCATSVDAVGACQVCLLLCQHHPHSCCADTTLAPAAPAPRLCQGLRVVVWMRGKGEGAVGL